MRRALPFAVALLAAACGASASSVKEARQARYDAPYPTVWNTVVEEVRRRYPEVESEDSTSGSMVTTWVAVDSIAGEPAAARLAPGASTTAGHAATSARLGASPNVPLGTGPSNLVRMKVHVRGAPVTVEVDGEGAAYQPGMKIVPFKHGAIDEPAWVQARVDALTVAIYDRLKQYAIKSAASQPASRPIDTTAWGNLGDPDAAVVVAAVRKAAAASDAKTLRSYMVSDFRWAEGADASADTALAMWSADPTALKSLIAALDGGCTSDAGSGDVICPGAAATARFRHVGRSWKFVEFTARGQ